MGLKERTKAARTTGLKAKVGTCTCTHRVRRDGFCAKHPHLRWKDNTGGGELKVEDS